MSTVERWHIGVPAEWTSRDGIVVTDARELSLFLPDRSPAAAIPFHIAMVDSSLVRTSFVHIQLPGYRGKNLIPLLAWLVTKRLAKPGAEVSWYVEKRQGPDTVRNILESLGWRLAKSTKKRVVRLFGQPPPDAILPNPRSFVATIGTYELTFEADYGVFSPDQIDAGTALLMDVALRHPPVHTVADVGVGYGALAIGLIRAGLAHNAVGSDIDCIALWLARRNACANGVSVDLVCDPDPAMLPASPLTVCNVPTHIDHRQTLRLVDGLRKRAHYGTVLAVVHASLRARFASHLNREGVITQEHMGPRHVVFEVTRWSDQP